MAVVEILESCLVTPGEATPKHRLWLSIFDRVHDVQGRAHTPLVYLYRDQAALSVDTLKAALSKALVPFYPIAGRLGSDPSGRTEIDCTGEGVLFVTARADTTLDELQNPAPSDELRRRLVPFAQQGELAMFQVTFFECGGVCLGTAMHHTVCDGRAFGHFLTTWAAIARGDSEGAMLLRPCLDRTLLRARSPPAVRFRHGEYPLRGSVPSAATKVPFDTAVLPVPKDQILALKAAATSGGGGMTVSTYSAMMAHVWRCSCVAKGLSGTTDSRVYTATCVRSRMRPPLPASYLGNAVARTRTTATKVTDIVSSPFATVADKVSAAVARMSDERIRSLVDYLEHAMSGDGPGLHLGQWAVADTDLLVVSWIGLPLIDLDFGWGRPSFLGRAVLNQGNLVYLVPCPLGDGQLNVTVSMKTQALSRFKELFYQGLEHYSLVHKHDAQDARGLKHAKL